MTTKNPEHTDKRKARLSPSVITAFIFAAGIAVAAAVYWDRNVSVNQVSFTGSYFTDTEELMTAAGVTYGVNPDSLDLSAVSKRIEALPYVKRAVPYVEPNGSLRISITERRPIALLVQQEYRSYVDADGVKLPVLKGKTQNVPLVYGFAANYSADTLKSRSFLQLRDFLVSAQKNEFGWATISEAAYDEEDGVVALSQENGVKLLFGEDDFDVKFENWEAFYGKIVRTRGIGSFELVDLRFLNQVVTHES